MGYDLHITRKEHWSDKIGNDIPLPEWLALVQSDPDMRLDGFAEATTSNGDVIRIESDGLSVWTAYSGHIEGRNMARFDFHHGCVVAKNPDVEIRRKMHQMAQRLRAKVQGDDGEYYGPDGQPEPEQ
jgi:hypothetical protein